MLASENHLYQTIVQFDKTIVLHRKLASRSTHGYIFCYCPLVGILFEVLRIVNYLFVLTKKETYILLNKLPSVALCL